MRVFWSQNAKRELRAIHDYIAQNSARYALGMVDRITQKTACLARWPRLGATVREYSDESMREILVTPYRIIYRIRASRVEVLSVVHSAKQLPDEPPGDA
jgi:toxin ParE1/3/4